MLTWIETLNINGKVNIMWACSAWTIVENFISGACDSGNNSVCSITNPRAQTSISLQADGCNIFVLGNIIGGRLTRTWFN